MNIIRKKLSRLIIKTGVLIILVVLVIGWFWGMRGFLAIEDQIIDARTKSTRETMQTKIYVTAKTCKDWAYWDEAYDFVETGKNREQFINKTLTPEALETASIDAMIFLDNQSGVVFDLYNNDDTTNLIKNNFMKNHQQEVFKFTEDRQGLINLDGEKVVVFAASPILHSNFSGPEIGSLVVFKIMDSDDFAKISEELQIPLIASLINSDDNLYSKAQQVIADTESYSWINKSFEDIENNIIFLDYEKKPVLLIQENFPREIFLHGLKQLTITAVLIAVVSLIMLKIFYRRFVSLFSKPLNSIIEFCGNITLRQDYKRRLPAEGNDEITELSLAINDLMEKVEWGRRKNEALLKMAKTEIESRADTEKALQASYENTEMIVKERTLQLQHTLDRLEKNQITLRQAVQAKERFLASMSHEIRTPLTSILGTLQLLEADSALSSHSKHFNQINEAIAHLLAMVQEITDYSRGTSGEDHANQVVFSLSELMAALNNFAQVKIVDKNLDFIIANECSLDAFLGDYLRIKQILCNFIDNAIKFTVEGHVMVHVTCQDILTNTVEICFEVEDSGIGIAKEDYERIFIAFHQLDNSGTRKFGGLGLGLAVCLQQADIIGGNITFDSVIEQGSIFRLTVKLKRATIDERSDSDRDIDYAAVDFAGKNVLIVDDNEVNREIIGKMFGLANAKASVAESGKAALNILQKRWDIEYIFLDLHMPEMDGIETAKRIRLLEKQFAMKRSTIVLLTADANPDLATVIRANDIDGIIVKPFVIKSITAFHTEQAEIERISRSAIVFYKLEKSLAFNKNIVLNILKKFAESYTNLGEKITAYIDNKDKTMLSNYIHTLKGNAANLHLESLADICITCEKSIEENDWWSIARIWQEKLKPEWETLYALCTNYIYKQQIEKRESSIADVVSFDEFESMLENHDSRCSKAWSALATKILVDAENARIKEKLQEHLAQYEFDEAKAVWQELKKYF